jgi:DNA-binding GntR family transcriptional regulator
MLEGDLRVVRKLRRTSLSVDAYAFVRDLLTNGSRYKPGEKISVEELSRELGVSRTPLWGAINRLEAEGIVEIVPRQGVYLINYHPDRVVEFYRVREALEGLAARLAAETVTERQITALEANLSEQRERLAKNDVKGYHALALDFHEQIARLAQNRTLQRMITSILGQIRAMGVQFNYMPTHLPQSCDDHGKLIAAFRNRDPDRAEYEARQHMRDLCEEISRTLRGQEHAGQAAKIPASL